MTVTVSVCVYTHVWVHHGVLSKCNNQLPSSQGSTAALICQGTQEFRIEMMLLCVCYRGSFYIYRLITLVSYIKMHIVSQLQCVRHNVLADAQVLLNRS